MFSDNPIMISSPVQMGKPNEKIQLYKGDFQLKQKDKLIELAGEVTFSWFPSMGSSFSGTVLNLPDYENAYFHLQSFFGFDSCDLIIEGLRCGEAYVWEEPTEQNGKFKVEGVIRNGLVIGDKSVAVSKVLFAVPNLTVGLLGNMVRRNAGGNSASSSRIVFEDAHYVFTLDKFWKHLDLTKTLQAEGGYLLLYAGELVKKSGPIAYAELEDIFQAFSTFLSFLNGRRCAPLFRQGLFEGNPLWMDCSAYTTDMHKNVRSWPQITSINGLSELWRNFRAIWMQGENKHFLIAAIHWYVEANTGAAFTEGSLIMAQTALELIYNWLIIEKKKLLFGKDVDGLSASNKFRLLLSELRLPTEVPAGLPKLKAFVEQDKEIFDGPEAIVQIRNAIIHSQMEKRKKLVRIDYMVKYQALVLGIWYLELSLLFVLGYEDKYFNRTGGSIFPLGGEIFVPWVKNGSPN